MAGGWGSFRSWSFGRELAVGAQTLAFTEGSPIPKSRHSFASSLAPYRLPIFVADAIIARAEIFAGTSMRIGRQIAAPVATIIGGGIALLISGSVPTEDIYAASMNDEQRASYLAIRRYQGCLNVAAEQLMRSSKGNPSDSQVELLGFACPKELDDAARKIARRADYMEDDQEYQRLTPALRVKFIKDDLAGMAWCNFRLCPIM